ncbi:Glycerophosphoryl diester phosphodiesterase [Friedmanniella luteola]|uniref:Glycerophosphoryl diester phosphodiesterase n=1 Tax=Friedmanniella luteola TaxID=546871 RepID=A0A1H1TGV4_9ACTN|nr:glycerophosphodiester phosphodiesterase [Friedmanniella luteola]SDS59462.1 Glycerophosphoryl diester phosphodiesterase [Friedmanniella luteola]
MGTPDDASTRAEPGPPAAAATRVADLVYPLTLSHRGGPDIYPENSWEAKTGSVSSGFVPEFDLQLLADGRTLVSCHDPTVDRTMTGIGPGPVSTKTVAEWQRARIRPAIPGGREGRPIFWDEVLDRWGGRVVLVPELKDPAGAAVFVEGVLRRGLAPSVIAQTFDWTIARQVAAAGIPTLFLSHRYPVQTPEQVLAAGIGFVGAALTGWSTAEVAALQAAGLKVFGFTADTVADATTPVALACDGIFSNDAWLTTDSIAVQSGDPFDDGVRPFGMGKPYRSGGAEVLTPSLRLAGRKLGWTAPTGSPTYVRAPWAGVVARPVRISMRVHFGPSTDQGENAGLVLLQHAMTRSFTDGAQPGQNALLFVVRRDGRLHGWVYADGAAAVALNDPDPSSPALVAPGAEGVVDFSVVLEETGARLHAQGGLTVADARLGGDLAPPDLGLVLRWPGTRAPGFPGFISDVDVAPLG